MECFCINEQVVITVFSAERIADMQIQEEKISKSLIDCSMCFIFFTRLILLRRILCCFCLLAGPILFPFPNEVLLEFKIPFQQPGHKFPVVSSARLPALNNASPSILNSLSLSRTQRRIQSSQPLHIFKIGKTDQQSNKMTGPLFETNAGTSPFV